MTVLLFGGLLAGGCATGALETKVDRLERELSDQRSITKRLEGRLDELQIQVSLLNRRLKGAAEPSGRLDRPSDMPALAVVRPQSRPAARRAADEPRPGRRKPWKLTTAKFDDVDPAEVTERLQVDRAAARRPLAGQDDGASGVDARVVAEEAAEDAEEAKVARAFQDAFGLYRINELDKAAAALTAFAAANSDHALAPEALFYAAKAQMMLGQTDLAEKGLLELVRAYPATERAAEAMLMVGRCQEKLGRVKDARGTYLQLVDAFPLSKQAGAANKRLQSIR